MRSRLRQISQQLGLASAMVLHTLLSGAVGDSAGASLSTTVPPPEFRLARLAYNDSAAMGGFGFGRRGGGSWTTDAPEAEYHLSQGIRRLTRINTIDPEKDDVVLPVQPLDPKLSEYPFLYAVEVGRWYLDDAEAAALRDYLLRGGLLMVDDFHGSLQWEGFMESMRRVFPEREVVDIPADNEIFRMAYDLQKQVADQVQIPGVFALMGGRTYEQDGVDPKWRGIFDDEGRLMVVINFNMDLGDAWEHADSPEYPQPLTALAYRFAISYALYAMTH